MNQKMYNDCVSGLKTTEIQKVVDLIDKLWCYHPEPFRTLAECLILSGCKLDCFQETVNGALSKE